MPQHTLDSDEEDDEVESKKYDVLTEDDVEGTEDKTVDFDDGEKITPFNMKEEMEEGHFDKQGNYFFKKDSELKVNNGTGCMTVCLLKWSCYV